MRLFNTSAHVTLLTHYMYVCRLRRLARETECHRIEPNVSMNRSKDDRIALWS